MRHYFTLRAFLKSFLTLSLLLFVGFLYAQKTTIQDYVIFGGNQSSRSSGHSYDDDDNGGGLVQIGDNSKITSGAIGSSRLIKTTGEVTIGGDIYSGGKIQLAAKNIVEGRVAAGNTVSYAGSVFSAGSYTSLKGDVDVNGNIYVGYGSKVSGKVTHPAGTTYSGPAPLGGNIVGIPSLPDLPQLPAITNFPTVGRMNITDSRSISPGSYNTIQLGGNKTLTFSGTGVYVFNAISNRGATNTFIFDFKNNAAGVIQLYVYGDVDLNRINVKFANGGDASRIYAEVHGNGGSCWDKRSAWIMDNGSGYPSTQISSWAGTVWAPFGGISIGSYKGNSTVTGALISGTQVNINEGVTVNFAPFSLCNPPDVNAGPDMELNMLESTKLTGSSTSPGVLFNWQGINGGKIISGDNTATAEVSLAGTYVLTATTAAGCFATDTVIVTGKIQDLIGSELKSLYLSDDISSPLSESIFLIQNDSVFIEVIAIAGQYDNLLSLLQSPEYGMTDLITNGKSKLIITGKFPIDNLLKLNSLPDLINFCRPVYPPVINAGVAQTAGDSAMRTNYVRNGFHVQGDSIRVGVMSDSYNTLPGNPATNDVINGDLPGSGNPENEFPIRVLKEFPYGQRTDEGRAMLQIVHDVAPRAKLSFRTGIISPGDLAEGIKELAADSCNVIVDDITFITEPFFKKGVVDSAITEVTQKGVSYITSAGNFGSKSYGAIFNPANAPAGLKGSAHNFGGGDILQSDSLKGSVLTPGVYTIVLQWVDDIYSLSGTGTTNDLDIYLADDNGNPIVGYNRNNIGGDPIEVLPFTVTSNTVANIMIINTSPNPSPNLRFKYVVFRGDLKINEFPAESSTILGHGNSAEAITVGAARYSKTPAFGSNPPVAESFSSTGGSVLINGSVSQKPDIMAPDGVNTTVNFGNVDVEGDGLPNFFGTSAAAPHVAGAAALLLQAGKKYNNELMTPANVKNTFLNSAIDMDVPGFDFNTGHGFIQADAALRTLANPTPQINSLQLGDSSLTPGVQPMPLIINGSYLSPDTKVIFGKDTLVTIINNSTQATVTLPVFYSDKFINVYTPPKTSSALDGGISNSISINGIPKKNITVIANNKTRKYGTIMPAFTATVLVDGDSLQHTSLTVSDLGLTDILYKTPASDTSSVGIYFIRPSREFDSTIVADSLLLEKYNYAFTDGALTITKLPVKITARDTTLVYGQKAGDFKFNYTFDSTATISDGTALLNKVETQHESQLATDVTGLVNGQAVVIVNGQALQIVNGQAIQIVNGQALLIVNGQALQIVNGQALQIVNGQALQIVNNLTEPQLNNMSFLATTSSLQDTRQLHSSAMVNGTLVPQTTNVVDITQESILKFNNNSAQTTLLNSVSAADPRGLVDVSSLVNGQALQIVNGQFQIVNGQALQIVNGQALQIVNGQALQIVNGQAIQIVNGQALQIVNGQLVPVVSAQNRTAVIINANDVGKSTNEFKSLNMITGLDAGNQFIIPAAFSNDNFDISYGIGKLTILPAPLSIKAMDSAKVYGTNLTLDSTRFSITSGALMYGDSILNVKLTSAGTTGSASSGSYSIIPGAVVFNGGTHSSNYAISFTNGTLTVGKVPLIVKANDAVKIYGDPNPGFTVTYSGFINGQTTENAGITGAPAFTTASTVNSGVGNYAIVPGQGSLSSANYTFSFVNGTLSIAPAPLYVKADDKVIFQYSRLPEFTAQITNLKAGDNPSVSFTLSPSCAGAPGVYAIIPRLKSFANAANYAITYTNGNLYINPKCGRAEDVQPQLSCVEQVSPGKYIAHFYAVNRNATTVYIPVGWSNSVYSLGSYDASRQPVVFVPGITKFDVPFDGNTLKWMLSSYDNCWYKTSWAYAGSWSQKCSDKLITQNSKIAGSGLAAEKAFINTTATSDSSHAKMIDEKTADNRVQGNLIVYPNPAQSHAIVYFSNEEINENGASLFDVNGKNHPVKLIRRISPNSFEIDISQLKKGFYFLKVKVSDGYRSVMIIKG